MSTTYFLLFFFIAWFSWKKFVDWLVLIVPLFVIVPFYIGFRNYSLAELGFLGGMCAILIHGSRNPHYFRSKCPLTLPLILFVLVAATSTISLTLSWGEWGDGFYRNLLYHGLVNSFIFQQESSIHTFGATTNIIEAVIFFHLALLRIQEPGGRSQLLKMMMWSGVIVSIAGILQFAFGWNAKSIWMRWNLQRINATWLDPNSFASFLIIPLTAAFAYWSGMKKRSLIQPPVLAVMLIQSALLITVSRSALIGLFVALFWFILLRFVDLSNTVKLPQIQHRRIAFAVVAVCIMIFVSLTKIDAQNPDELNWMIPNTKHGFPDTRLNIWRRSLLLVSNSPITGIGNGLHFLSTEIYHNPEIKSSTFANPLTENAHNQFIQYLVELGVIGGGIFLYITALLAFRAFQSAYFKDKRNQQIQSIIGAGTLALLITFLSGHPLIHKEMMLIFAALMALLFYPTPSDQPALNSRNWLNKYNIIIMSVSIITIFLIARVTDIQKHQLIGFYSPQKDRTGSYHWAGPKNFIYFKKTTPWMRFEISPDRADASPIALTLKYADQVKYYFFEKRGLFPITFRVPDHLIGSRMLLSIEFDKFWRPHDLDSNLDDRRELTVRFRNLLKNLNATSDALHFFPPYRITYEGDEFIAEDLNELENIPPAVRKVIADYEPREEYFLNQKVELVGYVLQKEKEQHYNCQFVFKINETISENNLIAFRGAVDNPHLKYLPPHRREHGFDFWDFKPQTPTNEWKAGQFVVVKRQFKASSIPYNLSTYLYYEKSEGSNTFKRFGEICEMGDFDFKQLDKAGE